MAERAGLVFAPHRRREAQAGVARAMAMAQVRDIDAYLALIRRDGACLDDLVNQLTVGETHFMRDRGQMDFIRREVVPAVQRRRRDGGAPPRLWSAGCASGEEAYSLAILLESEGQGADAFVLGTDLSAAALRKARAAAYSSWSMREVPADFRERYFRPLAGRHVLADRIRSRVHFAHLNLVAPLAYSAVGAAEMDLILCRNVLIYLKPDTVRLIAARLYECLAQGGVLLTGSGDPPLREHAPFEVTVGRAGLVYRRSHPPPPVASPHAPIELHAGHDAFARVRRHANREGARGAERLARSELRDAPLDAPLHHLRSTLLVALDRLGEAEKEARRAVYLDPTLSVAQFLLGTLLRKRGARAGALRAFRNTRALCAGRPADEELAAGEGERTGALLSAAGTEIARLEVALA